MPHTSDDLVQGALRHERFGRAVSHGACGATGDARSFEGIEVCRVERVSGGMLRVLECGGDTSKCCAARQSRLSYHLWGNIEEPEALATCAAHRLGVGSGRERPRRRLRRGAAQGLRSCPLRVTFWCPYCATRCPLQSCKSPRARIGFHHQRKWPMAPTTSRRRRRSVSCATSRRRLSC